MVTVTSSISIDDTQFRRAMEEHERRIRLAAYVTTAETTRGLEKALEDATRAAVPGNLYRAWKSVVYGTERSASPAGVVYVPGKDGKGNRITGRTVGAMQAYAFGARILGRRGQFLAIPTDAAGPTRLGRAKASITPEEWERRNRRKLRPIIRRGKTSLLVLDDAVLTGRGQAKPATERRLRNQQRAGRSTERKSVVIFVLVPLVSVGRRFDITGIHRAYQQQIGTKMGDRLKVMVAEASA